LQNNKKTIVILSPGFPENEADTTCLPAQQQFVQCLHEMHPELNIIVIAFQYPFVKATYQWKNITVISLNGMNRGKLGRLITWNNAWTQLRKLNRTHKIAGLLSFWCTECALVGQYFARKRTIPHFIWLLGQDAKKNNGFVRLIKPEAAQLIAMSDFLADEFYRNHGIRPGRVIPIGIDARLFDKTPKQKDIDVLGVGSLIPLKQYDVFIELMGKLVKKHPSLKAVICGKGPEHESLIAQIRKLGLENNVSLVGEMPNAEVLHLMQRSRILLHTSSYEGFGMVCLEALYAGAQVISFVKPMDMDVDHWHVVKNTDEMYHGLLKALDENKFESVLLFGIADTVRSITDLYNGLH